MSRTLLIAASALLLWSVTTPALCQVSLAEATGRRVTRIDVTNHSRVPDHEIRRLFLIRPGRPYSTAVAQQGLQLLAQKVEIADVSVRGGLEGADGLALTLEVSAQPLVYSIRFRGNRALDDDELRSRLRLEVDRPVRETNLRRDVLALEERYAEEGYPDAQVTATQEPMADPRWLRLVFAVQEAEPRRIGWVDLPADLPMERWRALALLGLKPGDPASKTQLKKGSKLLVKALHREGYPEARMQRPRFVERDGETVLDLALVSGAAIDLRFSGTDDWQTRSLRPLYRARFGEPITPEWLGDVSRAMVGQLRDEGYWNAEVAVVDGEGYGRRRVTFNVQRGLRAVVDEVEFEGNRNLSSRRLRKYMALAVRGWVSPAPFTATALDRDLKTLTAYYASKGYLDARVTVLDQPVLPNGRIRLLVHVDEGKSYRFSQVDFDGDLDLPTAELFAVTELRPGMRADPGALERARRNLLQNLAKRGRGHAKVSYTTEKEAERGEVRVQFLLRGGAPEYFGEIVVSGNSRTQTKVIQRELTFSEGELWNPEVVAESRRRIYRLGFFRSVRIEPMPAAVGGGVRNVRILVEEQDAGSLSFGFGYGREEGFKGSASIGYTNLQGFGRAVEFRASADRLIESYAVNFREPWLFNRPVDLRFSLLKTFENRDAYNLSSLSFQSALEKEYFERLRASLIYTLSQNRLNSVFTDAIDDFNTPRDYLSSVIGPVLAWDSRDNSFNPRRGFYLTSTVEWALPALGSEVRYDRYTATGAMFFSAGKQTLGLYAGGGIALNMRQPGDLPANERFFLGGRNTVRGYRLDEIGPKTSDGTAIGGDTMFNFKVEWRYPVWRKLGGVLFFDSGSVWDRAVAEPGDSGLRHGAGFGARYITPVGPLSLDIGWKVKPEPDEDPYVINFTVGNVF